MEEIAKSMTLPNIKLKKSSKGYSWEISISGEDTKEILKEIVETDEFLRNKFKGVKKLK